MPRLSIVAAALAAHAAGRNTLEFTENLDTHNAFKDLLGKDAEPRYQFIMEKADQAILDELNV